MLKLYKLGLLTISALGFVFLAGCSGNNAPQIDESTWAITTIQSAEAEGQIVACSSDDSEVFENAIEVNFECTAEEGELSLIDKMEDKTYTGSYSLLSSNRESSIYKITLDGTEGTAVSSSTTYNDGNQIPTLIVSLGDYTLNFLAE